MNNNKQLMDSENGVHIETISDDEINNSFQDDNNQTVTVIINALYSGTKK